MFILIHEGEYYMEVDPRHFRRATADTPTELQGDYLLLPNLTIVGHLWRLQDWVVSKNLMSVPNITAVSIFGGETRE